MSLSNYLASKRKYCSQSCSGKTKKPGRVVSKEGRIKMSNSAKRRYNEGKITTAFKKGHLVKEEWIERTKKANASSPKHTTPHSTETKLKISLVKTGKTKGKDNPNWKGGHSENYNIRRTKPYEKWRKMVFERDNYTCVGCGTKGYITAHHIKSVSSHFHLALDVDNGMTLCEPCHCKTDNYKGRAKKQKTKPNQNEKQTTKSIALPEFSGNTDQLSFSRTPCY